MIRNPREVERAKRQNERDRPLTQEQKYAILDALYEEAKRLDRFTFRDSGERMKHKLAMARILNAGV